jgi:molybdopterin converting factor small subunit
MIAGASADAVWAALPPEVRNALDPATTRIALNGEWADPGTPVGEGDELALVPPVSGG